MGGNSPRPTGETGVIVVRVMGLADLFASNLLIKWLRGDTTGQHELTVTMSGLQRGDRVVQLGGDPTCIAALAAKTGLSGRAVYTATHAEAIAQADAAAGRAGVLVETVLAGPEQLPLETSAFDLALIDDPSQISGAGGPTLMAETWRLLREGGRCLVVVTLATGRQDARSAEQLKGDAIVQQPLASFTTHGFRGARVLAAREGRAYLEAAKPRSSVGLPTAGEVPSGGSR